MILEAEDDSRWKLVTLSRNGPSLSHLFFYGCCFAFLQETTSQAWVMEDIFTKFAGTSSIKVSISKSIAFFSKAFTRAKINTMVFITGIHNNLSLDKYLGFPIFHGRMKRGDYDFLVDKVHTRLTSLRNKLLNKARRLTIARSVLNAIPTYYVQITWIP